MTHRPRLLAIIGSGETAPTMAKTHRMLVDRLGPPPIEATLLDTPYGFQENAEEVSRRAIGYFRDLGIPMDLSSWRGVPDDTLTRERALARITDAHYVFSGPGSPTYALGVWKNSGLRDILDSKLRTGGCVSFASAAALTLGVATVPVYEIYKVGQTPFWAEGMDLLTVAGLRAAVIPHYDNAEGGTHDTRYCYLGERRLRRLESVLEPEVVVLGVDEHTACVFDLDADLVTILGRGTVTVRRQGVSTVFPAGCAIPVQRLRTVAAGEDMSVSPVTSQTSASHTSWSPATNRSTPSLSAEARRLEAVFDAALTRRDVDTAVSAVLDLEQAIVDWSADTEEMDTADQPRAALRRMVTRLGELAAIGARDPREVVAPFVDALVAVREQARAAGWWTVADGVRDRLTEAGVEVRDTPSGAVWLLAASGERDKRAR